MSLKPRERGSSILMKVPEDSGQAFCPFKLQMISYMKSNAVTNKSLKDFNEQNIRLNIHHIFHIEIQERPQLS